MPGKAGRPRGSKNKGNYYIPHPVDFAILERMPPEGQMLGWHVIAATAHAVAESLNEGLPREQWITIPALTGRLVSMHAAGLLVQVPLLSQGGLKGWQRTAKGDAQYEEHTGNKLSAASAESKGGGS